MWINTKLAPKLPAPTMLSRVPYWLRIPELSGPPCASAATVPRTNAVVVTVLCHARQGVATYRQQQYLRMPGTQ